MRTHLLKPGEFLLTREPLRVSTVLGSCVAVTLHCRRTHDAAICHALLPHPRAGHESDPRPSDSGRYLTDVLPLMLDHFASNGCKPAEIHAKVFGGASLTKPAPGTDKAHEVGIENATLAFDILLRRGIQVRAANTGGASGHHIVFNTASGEVLHRLLKPTETHEYLHHA